MYEDRDRSKWRRFICKVLCCLVLLYGDPLLAIQLNATPRPDIARCWHRAQELWSTLEPSLRLPDLDLDSAGLGALWEKLTRFRGQELGPGVGERNRSLSAPGGVVQTATLGGGALSAALASYLGWSHTTVAQGPPRLPAAPPAPPGFQEPKGLPPTHLPADSVGFLKSVLDEIPLLPGANLISLPEEPNDPDPAVVLNAIAGAYTKVYAYDACDSVDPWKTYDPNDPAGSDLTALDHKIGFWIDVTQPVELPSDGVIGPGLAIIATLPELRSLNLGGTQIKDDGLAFLRNHPSLRRLTVNSPHVTDEGVSHLAAIPQIEILSITGTSITGSGLRHLKSCEHLKGLSLDARQLTNVGISNLKKLHGLRDIWVNELYIKPEQERELLAALPNLKINKWRLSL